MRFSILYGPLDLMRLLVAFSEGLTESVLQWKPYFDLTWWIVAAWLASISVTVYLQAPI